MPYTYNTGSKNFENQAICIANVNNGSGKPVNAEPRFGTCDYVRFESGQTTVEACNTACYGSAGFTANDIEDYNPSLL